MVDIVYLKASGLRGRRGLPSGPLGDGTVDADTIANSPSEQDAISRKITTKRAGLTAAEYRSIADKVADRFDIRDMLGMDITGNNDMASTLSAAFAEDAPIHMPLGSVLALGSTVPVYSNSHVLGPGGQPYTTLADGGSRGQGAWFHIAHDGVGFACAGNGVFGSNMKFEGVGTFRDQPVPAPGWEPNDHDFDFTIDNCDIELNDVMLLNATRGVRQISGPAGRLYARKLRGSPFLIGIQIDDSYDGLLMDGVRWWPFWSNDLHTRAYTMANRVGMHLRHCDNPQISWYFNIFSKTGVLIGSHPNGVVNSANFYNLENDLFGGRGIVFEPGSTGSHVTVIGGYSFGEVGSTNAVEMNSDSAKLITVAHKFANIQQRALLMGGGTGNVARICAPDVQGWNVVNGGYDAFTASTGNKIIIDGQPLVAGGNGAKLTNSNVGLISCTDYADITGLGVTAQIGSISSATAAARLRRVGNSIDGSVDATVTNNGTGSGDLRIALPVAVASGQTYYSTGRNLTTGKMLQVQLNSNLAVILSYDNNYPVVSGDLISFDVRYETAPFL
ncbi:MAG: hypothetical protein ACSLE1_01970 [Sphingobium sp.]